MRYEVYCGCQRLSCNRWPVGGGDPFYRLLLIFAEDELIYDISNIAYAQGDVARVHDNYGHDMLADDRLHLMHQWMDVVEDGNRDRVRRVIAMAISEVEQMLYKYAKHRMGGSVSLDNRAEDKAEYLVELKVPTDFSDTTCWYLLREIHEYIIDKVLEDWAGITYPEAQPVWAKKVAETAERIKHASTIGGKNYWVKPSII